LARRERSSEPSPPGGLENDVTAGVRAESSETIQLPPVFPSFTQPEEAFASVLRGYTVDSVDLPENVTAFSEKNRCNACAATFTIHRAFGKRTIFGGSNKELSMSNHNIVRAWKNPAYRNSLSEAERAALPANPAGSIELSDADLGRISGGNLPITYVNTRYCTITERTPCFTTAYPKGKPC
jgi:mersacidin/lichenicidin family type 2 lantibiotic